ncbi:DUF167 domain-containing protein [Candidatus Peregrinibacteria bacterium]|nr:DUF167 domain-containing protein [Candidatus Peregrinibacteria bacterium]
MKPVYLNIKISAGAQKTALKGKLSNGTLKISIAAPPEKGKANAALIKFLASHFHVAPQRISIERGANNPLKLIKIVYD